MDHDCMKFSRDGKCCASSYVNSVSFLYTKHLQVYLQTENCLLRCQRSEIPFIII